MCCAKLLQSCPTLCDPMDCSLSGSSIHGILQAKILEWVAVSFRDLLGPGMKLMSLISPVLAVGLFVFFFLTISTTWEARSVHNCNLFKPEIFSFLIHKVLPPQADQEIKNSLVQLFVTPWTVDPQVPRSVELSRQEYWSGQPSPSPGERTPRRAK